MKKKGKLDEQTQVVQEHAEPSPGIDWIKFMSLFEQDILPIMPLYNNKIHFHEPRTRITSGPQRFILVSSQITALKSY